MNQTTLNRLQTNAHQQTTSGIDLNPLKLTALLYLAETRARENYELMGEIVHYAREFGATNQEIRAVLAA
ncbi:MAG: hypothetical protein AB7S78_10865 [Candidatus Omnitrophota bacterium]